MDLREDLPVRMEIHYHRRKMQREYDMHYALELGMVLTGRMKRFCRGYEQMLTPGDVWLCGIWEPHGYEIIKTPCEVAVFVVWPPLLANLRMEEASDFSWFAPFAAPPAKRPHSGPSLRPRLLEIGKALKQLAENGRGAERLWPRLRLLEILLLLTEQWQPIQDRIASFARPDAFERVNQAIQLSFQNTRAMRVQEVARRCGLSRNAFAKLFRQFMGLSYADFNLRYRLTSAATCLRSASDPVKAVATQWGFTDASHFHRHFHRHYQCSPYEYRQRSHGSGEQTIKNGL